jgi:hypothetical protein
MKKHYLKSYANERALTRIKNSDFVLFFAAHKINTKEKQDLQLSLKQKRWSFLHCSSKELNTFNGALYLISGNDLLPLLPILKSKKNLEKNFLGLLINKVIYKKNRFNELVNIEQRKANQPQVLSFLERVDPKVLIGKTLIKPLHISPINFLKVLERHIKNLIIILDYKLKNN